MNKQILTEILAQIEEDNYLWLVKLYADSINREDTDAL